MNGDTGILLQNSVKDRFYYSKMQYALKEHYCPALMKGNILLQEAQEIYPAE